ncbi:MAG: hypothetical protein CM1200mP34_2800 [Verrucomicrobiales bacterium]|nr:MAG: hypothetical protein CM1200mP34_2800 [Verrucomicrobiales bacterium]
MPFNNSVMGLPGFPARMLGLDEEKTDFQFRLLNLGPSSTATRKSTARS